MFKQFGTLARIGILLFVTLVCVMTAVVVGSLINLWYSSAAGIDYQQTASTPTFIRIYQIVTSSIMFIVPAWLCAMMFHNNVKEGFCINRSLKIKPLFFSLAAMAAALPLAEFLTAVNSHLSLPESMSGIEEWMRMQENRAKAITENILVTDNFGTYLINIIVMALVPAIGEELYFRATLQNTIARSINPIWAAVITAVLFSTFHLQFYGFLPRLLLGFLLGYMLVCTQNIIVPVAAHFFNNFVAITAYYFTGNEIQIDENQSVATFIPIAVISTAAVATLLYLLWKNRYPEKKEIKKQDFITEN